MEIQIDDVLTEAQAADLLKVTPRCLQSWRQQKQGPRFVRASNRVVRYRRVDLERWMADRLSDEPQCSCQLKAIEIP